MLGTHQRLKCIFKSLVWWLWADKHSSTTRVHDCTYTINVSSPQRPAEGSVWPKKKSRLRPDWLIIATCLVSLSIKQCGQIGSGHSSGFTLHMWSGQYCISKLRFVWWPHVLTVAILSKKNNKNHASISWDQIATARLRLSDITAILPSSRWLQTKVTSRAFNRQDSSSFSRGE